jgi:hypothetical protein
MAFAYALLARTSTIASRLNSAAITGAAVKTASCADAQAPGKARGLIGRAAGIFFSNA